VSRAASARFCPSGVIGGNFPLAGSEISHSWLFFASRCSYQCVGPAPVSAPPMRPAAARARSVRSRTIFWNSASLSPSSAGNWSGRSSGTPFSSVVV